MMRKVRDMDSLVDDQVIYHPYVRVNIFQDACHSFITLRPERFVISPDVDRSFIVIND